MNCENNIHINDVRSPIDLKDPIEAKQWAAEVNLKRPWRYDIFQMYVDSILALNPNAHVLELGSGPGYLAEFLINHCPNIDYTAFDFSEAMHDLAKEKLSAAQRLKCNFITGDFKQSAWEESLHFNQNSTFDVIIIHQALHELRHKAYAAEFHRTVKTLLNTQGVYFVCDHLYAPHAQQNHELYMSVEEHLAALKAANFGQVEFIGEVNGLVIFKNQHSYERD